jgi:hypothetical protein|tara:strand:+ start:184 stop:471 length:288 start_codon:yes stop_codon:yes gene_type:complete
MANEKLDYNIMSMDGVKDSEYVELFGVPKDIANTPEINNWLINDTYEKNLELEYNKAIGLGRSEAEANSWAAKVANKGKQEAKNNLKLVQSKRGY